VHQSYDRGIYLIKNYIIILYYQEQNDKIYTAARYDDLDTLEEMNSSGVIVTKKLVSRCVKCGSLKYLGHHEWYP